MAKNSMEPQLEQSILVLTGYMPEKSSPAITGFLDGQDCAYLIEEPATGEDVPIKLKNPAYAKLFEPIGKLFSLPDYHEIDTVPFFAPFFAFYFGLCLGDMGYGIVLLSIVVVALFKVQNKQMRQILKLGAVLGSSTIVGGLLLNTFFGTNIVEASADGTVVANATFFEWLKPFVAFSDSEDRTSPMVFAIMLGIFQVLLGQGLSAYNKIQLLGKRGVFQPLGTGLLLLGAVMMIMNWMIGPTEAKPLSDFAVGPIPVGSWLAATGDPSFWGSWLAISGVALVFVYHILESGAIWMRPLTALWDLYNIITGLLGDILSYIRLFALGLAGGLLGAAFNGIALDLKDLPGGVIYMILVMVFGHTLNFLLASLGAFVHPLRLTFVEFYKAVGFKGGGKPFSPFTKYTLEKQ
jgi:V/A-type H+/Na+-transporting ATPase subunit I